jgi:hypothetical protein
MNGWQDSLWSFVCFHGWRNLEMSSGNTGAEAFYRSLGFQELFRDEAEDELIMGLELGDENW